MKFFNKKKGDRGEQLAADYLKSNGWKIIETNFSVKWGEIDIVCSKDNVLSFVEVKAKTSDQFGPPEQMINKSKIMQIKRMADLFLGKNKRHVSNHDTYRIDVIAITLDETQAEQGGVAKLNYYENVGAEFI